MNLKRAGSQASIKGAEAHFTGAVRMDPLSFPPEPSRVSVVSVTFEPGARSAWHTHPLGQTLIVTAGCGWTQCEGEPIVEIRAGDVIWCPPGHKHWHGASATTSMTHIGVQEALDGVSVVWLEKVTDEEYRVGPTGGEHDHACQACGRASLMPDAVRHSPRLKMQHDLCREGADDLFISRQKYPLTHTRGDEQFRLEQHGDVRRYRRLRQTAARMDCIRRDAATQINVSLDKVFARGFQPPQDIAPEGIRERLID